MNSVKVEQNIYCGGVMIVNNLSELLVRKWNDNGKNLSVSQLEKCSYSELFWSVFSRIRTEYREIRRISLYADQNNFEYGHFLHSVYGKVLLLILCAM